MPSHVARFGLAMLPLWLVLSTAAPLRAQVNELQEFELARNAYESQNYPLAVSRFEALVGGAVPRLQTRALVLESRKYLGASYLFRAGEGDRQRAEGQFEALLRQDGSYELDPIAFPTEILDVFTSVRSRIRDQIAAEQAARQRAEAERLRREAEAQAARQRRFDQLLRLAGTETVERENSRWLALLPFGVGQFQNGNDELGLTIAITEGALAVTSIVTWLYYEYLRGQPTSDPDFPFAESLTRTINQISVVSLGVVVVAGLVDAQIRFRPVIRTTRPREVPPDLREGLRVTLSPAGFRLEF